MGETDKLKILLNQMSKKSQAAKIREFGKRLPKTPLFTKSFADFKDDGIN